MGGGWDGMGMDDEWAVGRGLFGVCCMGYAARVMGSTPFKSP